jgi:murein DD-endopeptidase MepM/ murein hydrolase activator NlpD
MRKLISLIVAILAAVIAIPLLGGAAIFGGGMTCMPTTPASATTAPAASGPAMPSGSIPAVEGWDAEQLGNVATILTVGTSKAVPPWAWVVATATAMQESTLRNLPGGADDSIGLFQQRPSQGWGTLQQLRDPAYQAGKFFDKLVAIAGWQQMPLTEAAQNVQLSAYPDAYAKHTTEAIRLISHVVSSGNRAMSVDLEQCLSNCPEILSSTGSGGPSASPEGVVEACGWVAPVRARIVSGFRTADRPGHDGVDLGAARGTPIRAASAGVVVVVRCNVVPASHGCDRDGSPSTPGCGWYVELRHAEDVFTRYCHMLARPAVVEGDPVVAGQVIGVVGSSGHSSGPHLHFEVRLGGRAGVPVDPVVFMATRAPIGHP